MNIYQLFHTLSSYYPVLPRHTALKRVKECAENLPHITGLSCCPVPSHVSDWSHVSPQLLCFIQHSLVFTRGNMEDVKDACSHHKLVHVFWEQVDFAIKYPPPGRQNATSILSFDSL